MSSPAHREHKFAVKTKNDEISIILNVNIYHISHIKYILSKNRNRKNAATESPRGAEKK